MRCPAVCSGRVHPCLPQSATSAWRRVSRLPLSAARSNHREFRLTLHSAVPADLRHLHGQRGVETPARTPARRRAPHAVCYNHPGRCAESHPARPRAALGFLTILDAPPTPPPASPRFLGPLFGPSRRSASGMLSLGRVMALPPRAARAASTPYDMHQSAPRTPTLAIL